MSLLSIPNDVKFTSPWFYEITTEYQRELFSWLRSKNIGCRLMYPELTSKKLFILIGNLILNLEIVINSSEGI